MRVSVASIVDHKNLAVHCIGKFCQASQLGLWVEFDPMQIHNSHIGADRISFWRVDEEAAEHDTVLGPCMHRCQQRVVNFDCVAFRVVKHTILAAKL